MTWVKICGTTNLEDARLSLAEGADALGFVFAPSPRRISPEDARKIIAALPGEAEKVGVFVNQPARLVVDTVRRAGLTAVQLHGDESPVEVRELLMLAKQERISFKVIKGIRMSTVDDSFSWGAGESGMLTAMLLDSGTPIQRGGTGKPFDWDAAAPLVRMLARRNKIVVAGGLEPANVAKALSLFHPWGVDVVSGVEQSKGKKDPVKLKAFFAAVKKAGQREENAEESR